jgi:hypothetical protein
MNFFGRRSINPRAKWMLIFPVGKKPKVLKVRKMANRIQSTLSGQWVIGFDVRYCSIPTIRTNDTAGS